MLSSDNLQVGSYVTIPNGKMPPSDHSNVTPIAGNWLMPNAYHNEGILSYSVRRGVGNGQCVAYAKSASGLTQYSGNAITWTRYVNSQTPQKGAVVVLNVGKYGHLAVVTNITDKTITVSEQNFIGRYIIDSRNLNINDSDILGYVTH